MNLQIDDIKSDDDLVELITEIDKKLISGKYFESHIRYKFKLWIDKFACKYLVGYNNK